MSNRLHAKRAPVAIREIAGDSPACEDAPANRPAWFRRAWDSLRADMAQRLRNWREDRRTWVALRHLDDRQLREFGIFRRPPDLAGRQLHDR